MGKSICITYQKLKMNIWIYVFVYSLCFEYVFDVFVRCVEDFFFVFVLCVCVFFFDMYCMCLNLSSEFVLWNLSWTKWLIESKELLCSNLHPSTTTKSIMVPNSRCQPPWLTWNFWMSTLWQLVGFYLSMPCSQKLCKNVQMHYSTNMASTWHLSRSWILTWVCANMEPFFLPNVGFRESISGWFHPFFH